MSLARASTLESTRSGLSIDGRLVARGCAVSAVLLLALFVLPLVGADWTKTFTSVAIYSVVAAGLGILYGRVGMISLGQIAVLAVAAWIGARLAYATSIPFPLLLLVTGLITGGIGVLIGLPALRLGGLHLALITLMLAGAVDVVLNTWDFPNGGRGFIGHISAGNLEAIQNVRRPAIARGDTAYYRYVVIVSALMFLLALLHVSRRPGRAWAAIRASETGALAAGVNVGLYKLWAFALAGFMTGVAGCLLAAHEGTPTVYAFPPADSLTVVATALIGGVYTLWGAVVAGAFMQLFPFVLETEWGVNENFLLVLFGVGLIHALTTAPGGVAEEMPKNLAALARLIRRGVRSAGAALRVPT